MANKKRKCDDDNEVIRQKIRRLEEKLRSNRRRIMSSSSSEEDSKERTPTRSTAAARHDESPAPSSAARHPSTAASGRRPPPATTRAERPPSVTSSAAASAPEAACAAATSSPEAVPSTSAAMDHELDEEVLGLLGDAPVPETVLGKAIHKDIASRWQDILAKGLSKEVKDKLMKEYLIPMNCDLLVSPVLNPEVKAALPESMVKRDTSLCKKQKQIGIALAALSQAIEFVVNKETSMQKILKPLGDACRLLCDSHYSDTNTRRGFASSAINSDLKDTLGETKRDKFLFGSNITEQVKSAKSIKRSGTDLRQAKNDKSHIFNKNNFIKNKNNSNNRLNWKTVPRKAPNKPDYSRSRPTQRPVTRSSFQQRDKVERSPPRRHRRQ